MSNISETNDRELKILLANIASLRKRHGLSKREMAKKLGISIYVLNKIESREFPKGLTVEILHNIYLNFGICPSKLFQNSVDE